MSVFDVIDLVRQNGQKGKVHGTYVYERESLL
jgi:hypothetical protein